MEVLEIKIVIVPTDAEDKDDISKLVEALTKAPLKIMPEIRIEPAPSQIAYETEFDLTDAMLEVLKQNKGMWFNAVQIERRILEKFPAAGAVGYKPGGIRKGIAASGQYLEKDKKVVVDKSEGPGSYKYKFL